MSRRAATDSIAVRKTGHVARLHQGPGCVVHDLRNAAHAGGDDRQTTGHRLEQHDRQVLEPARQHEQVGCAHGLRDRSGIARAEEAHGVAEAEPIHLRAQLRQQLALADDVERRRRAQS